MELRIITPKTAPRSIQTEKVFFPGSMGKFEIMDNHAPLVASLCEGDVKWEAKGSLDSLHISGGFVEVNNNVVTAVVEE